MNRAGFWTGLAVCVVALNVYAKDPWQQVNQKSHPKMPGDSIQMIKQGLDKDQVWICTLTGAAKIGDGAIQPLDAAKNMKVWDVARNPAGGIWIGHGEGVMLLDGDRKVAALGKHSVAAIQMVGTQLWAIANDSATDQNTLVQANGEEWAPVTLFKNNRVNDLVNDGKGTFWLVLDADGVVEYNPVTGPKKHHLPNLRVMAVMTDSKGQTWCGLDQSGLMVRQKDNTWKPFLGNEQFTVLSIVEDDEGRIWAATSGHGVWVFDGAEWKGMLQDEGSVNLLKVTSDKRVWVSTQIHGGLRCWDGGEWKVSLEGSMPMRCLEELPNGVLMAGGVLDGLYILGDYSIKGE